MTNNRPNSMRLAGTLVAIGASAIGAGAISVIAAFVTHVVACIQASAWILLAFGVLVPPIGIIHGVMVWLGMWHP